MAALADYGGTIIRVGSVDVLQLVDANDNSGARHQYVVTGRGPTVRLWARRLPWDEFWMPRSRTSTPTMGPVAEWMRRATPVPLAVLRRLIHSDMMRRDCYRVFGVPRRRRVDARCRSGDRPDHLRVVGHTTLSVSGLRR